MKKRILSTILLLSMVISLTACSSSAGSSSSNTGASASAESKAEVPETEAPHEENTTETTALTESESAIETEAQTEAQTEAAPNNTITFDGLTAVDNDECSINLNEIDADNMWGYTIKATLENKSADTTYMFAVEAASVNGVQVDPLFATEVSPGKKANDDIVFPSMEKYGITEITDIELFFRVYDTNDWTADAVADESVHVYPYGEENTLAFVREPSDTDTVLVDDDNVTAVITDIYEDDIWGYTLDLYLENNTNTDVMFAVEEASINGIMADPFFASSLKPGKCTFSSISWADSTLEENNIETVEEIEFKLRVYNDEDWLEDDLLNETFTINP